MWTQGQSLNSKTGDGVRKTMDLKVGYTVFFGGILFKFQLKLKIVKMGLTILNWKTTEKLIMKILPSPDLYLLTDSQAIPFCITMFPTSFPSVLYFARWPAQKGTTKTCCKHLKTEKIPWHCDIDLYNTSKLLCRGFCCFSVCLYSKLKLYFNCQVKHGISQCMFCMLSFICSL